MDEPGAKSARRLLRVIADHWRLTCVDRGAGVEALDLVDVIFHPTNSDPALNVVTPRRSTAWVAANYIQPGLARLRDLGRTPRVQYIAGLYPPQFAVVLRDLGLSIERETPLMVFDPAAAGALDMSPPHGGSLVLVSDDEQRRLWHYVWRSAYYDVNLLGLEDDTAPTPQAAQSAPTLKRKLEAWVAQLEGQTNARRTTFDYLYFHHNHPMGAGRLIIRPDLGSAHLETLALHEGALRDISGSSEDGITALRSTEEMAALAGAGVDTAIDDAKEDAAALRAEMLSALIAAALRSAHAEGCKLVFVPAEDEAERRACRRVGFIDLSSIVRYAAASRWEGGQHVAEAVFSP